MPARQFAKLFRMSPGEICSRLGEQVRVRVDRMAFGNGNADSFVNCATRYRRHSEKNVAAIQPDQLLRASHSLVGRGAPSPNRGNPVSQFERWDNLGQLIDLARPFAWDRDPLTGHEFPRTFHADVPLLQESGGRVDVKYVWELGRQQYVVALAREWLLGGEDRAAERARDLVISWIDDNPMYEGVHWTSALELSMRAISWIWMLSHLAEWDGWRDGELAKIAGSLQQHAHYLSRHFSYYSSPYNHLIGEAAGLYLISLVLPEARDAVKWRKKARRVLSEHGPKQFYPDGFCVEQAMGYHYYTLGFLTLAIIAARRAGEPLQDLEPPARKAFRTAAAFQQPNGRWPALGDIDNARSIPVIPDDLWDFSGLQELGEALFEGKPAKCDDPGREAFWLLGAEVADADTSNGESTPGDSALSNTLLPESGYAIGRCGGDWALFDCGPIAHGLHADATVSTAHGHLDLLQVLYVANGEPVLVDGGMPFYFGNRDWVRHFRGAAAHNTLQIEGLPFAVDAGPLEWSHVVSPGPIHSQVVEECWLARGEVSVKGGRVQRQVVMIPEVGLWVADEVQLSTPRNVTWYWNLGENVARTECPGPGEALVRIGPASWNFQALGEAGESAAAPDWKLVVPENVEPGVSPDPIGWRAEGYGQRAPGATVILSQRGRLLRMVNAFRQQPVDVGTSWSKSSGAAESESVRRIGLAGPSGFHWIVPVNSPVTA